jgi:pilus assembly protein FimV
VLGGAVCWGLLQGSALAQVHSTLLVQPGDTASALALPLVPEGATLEQMLVALLRSNPEAFIDDNVNLLRAGQSLRVPDTAQVLGTSAEQARETVLEHHSRFREYAQRLALQARTLPESSARELSGRVTSPNSTATRPGTGQDKLTLTKDLQDAQAMKIALEKQTQEAMVHLAALQKNIEALQRLSQASDAASAAPATSTGSPVIPVWAWITGLLGLALTLVLGLRRRDAAPHPDTPAHSASGAVPPQIAHLSLELDSPAADAPAGRQP